MAKLYELLAYCIPANAILKKLYTQLLRKLEDPELKHDVCHWLAYYEEKGYFSHRTGKIATGMGVKATDSSNATCPCTESARQFRVFQ